MKRTVLLLLAAACLLPSAFAQSRFDVYEVAWTMAPDPGGDFLNMTMRLEPLHERDRVIVRIPWWRPGSYRYASYEQKISELRATDQAGAAREIVQLDPRTWEIDTHGATQLEVDYVLAVENEARTGDTPSIHLHSPATFLYVEDYLEQSHTLRFELPEGWDAASGHRPDSRVDGLFRSPNYDVFVDCPIAIGAMERHSFEAVDRPFDVVFFGRVPSESRFSRADWVETCRRIVVAAHEIMGPPPFEKYTFLFLFYNQGGIYGLEHLNSTTIATNVSMLNSTQGLQSLESVTAHEYFHLWNVKRIRPSQLGPFDYKTDVRTNDLWWLEGLTSYYADVILQRAGLRGDSSGWFLDAQARTFNGMRTASGYGKVSPERSSWSVWDPSRLRISYYDQGQVLGLLLDIEIRHATGNQRSLDDVFRFLTRWVDYPGAGYRAGDLERAIRSVTGWDCAQFFDHHISGLIPPPYETVMPRAGVQVINFEKGDPYLGFGLEDDITVTVREGTTAYEAGLRPGDRLRAIAGQTINSISDMRDAILTLEIDTLAEVLVTRDGAQQRLQVPVRARSRDVFLLRPASDATEDERAILYGVLTGTPESV